MLGSLSGDLQSHPGKKLSDHLLGTDRLAQQIVDLFDLEDLKDDVGGAALTHDLGKADGDFQLYLHGKGKGVEHSRPSAYFALSLMQGRKDPFDALFSAEAVRRHHTRLEPWGDIVAHWTNMYCALSTARGIMQRLVPDWPYALDKGHVKKFAYAVDDRLPEEHPFPDYWLKLRTLLSILVAGDRLDAINVKDIDFASLPAFVPKDFERDDKSERRKQTDEWRAEAAQACLEAVSKIDRPGLFTLTLPTGAGKTNIGLKVARMLAEKLGLVSIIYALPFISIVEQNAEFAKEVFGPNGVQEDHSLVFAKDEQDEEKGDEIVGLPEDQAAWIRARKLFRYWEAPVVVTTMAQLWRALLDPKASATIDFHRLRKAVVLMDEPQGIAPSLWHGLGKLLSFIHERWETVFILMTATQPKIYDGVELAPPLRFPFERHRYRFVEGDHRLEDVPALLQEHVPGYKERSGMMVFNTRMAARRAWDMIKEHLPDAPVFMLSRWMTPQHRRETIKEIKALEKAGARRYLIATQVVEAGVDLDFDWAFRDMGPVDSIIQVAGRCDRNAEREAGTVLIAELKDGDGRKFSGIYDAVLLDATRRLLGGSPEFGEGEVPELVERYYEDLVDKIDPAPVWENIRQGKWGEFVPLFKEDSFDVPVYVDRDGKLDEIFDELMIMDKSLENRDKIKALNARLQQHAIGVSQKRLKEWLDHSPGIVSDAQEMLEQVGDLYYVIHPTGIGEERGKIYHPVSGFSPHEDGELEDW